MPAKNASRYLRRTLESIAKQTAKKDLKVLMVYAESFDDTLAEFKEICKELELEQEVLVEKDSLYHSVYTAFDSIATEYYSVMCFSDAYISDSYLEDAMQALDTNSLASYVHADILTLYENGYIRNGLEVRNIIRSESGSRFTANICMVDDGINELTLVGRSQQTKVLLAIARSNRRLFVNPYGALFTMYLVFGCTGVFIPRYAVYGRHHKDSRNNDKELSEHDGQWKKVYDAARRKTMQDIISGRLRWRDGKLQQIIEDEQQEQSKKFIAQLNYIDSVVNGKK